MKKDSSESNKQQKQQVQRKLLQFQLLQANLHALEEREELLLERLQELQETEQALSELKNIKSDSETLIPLGSGNFISGRIADCEKVLVGMGGGLAIEKPQEKALNIVKKRIDELTSSLRELSQQHQLVLTELQRLQPELQKLAEEK